MLLLPDSALDDRRRAAAGPLAPLADALRGELAPLLETEPFIPARKARLTRAGGRCPRDGAPLAFDPWQRDRHRCPRCGETFAGDAHEGMWVMSYQLWLAERCVHAALLALLRGDEPCARLARETLARLADRYESWPNRDNVLGPSRPFFSTYLESIWLLQLVVATDLLERAAADGGVGGAVRERLVAPSTRLIATYPEGASNRQVWNAAALLASALLLGDRAGAERMVHGEAGVSKLLSSGLLVDGSWYEGENYHLFAHRGLWYGVVLAETAGIPLSPALLERFQEGFATPFLTALPDFTFPARRDSQHGVSLRQWRFAELCELGLARRRDPRLRAALATIYDPGAPPGDTGRARSTAEAERNEPPVRLSRADLGWRSLLRALPELAPPEPAAPASAILEGQGFAVLRRDRGRVYLALDYGHSGGGHGHPDRLGVLWAHGDARWLDDYGTGSYVERSLHWYRSTLAHNAPLIDGRSQARVDGRLVAFEERGGAGWV
ncbi:MAG TPA: heparinase II/III family protein, partial [Gemmatimonadaceae bacterium]